MHDDPLGDKRLNWNEFAEIQKKNKNKKAQRTKTTLRSNREFGEEQLENAPDLTRRTFEVLNAAYHSDVLHKGALSSLAIVENGNTK